MVSLPGVLLGIKILRTIEIVLPGVESVNEKWFDTIDSAISWRLS